MTARRDEGDDGTSLYEQMRRPAPLSAEGQRIWNECAETISLTYGFLIRELWLDPNDSVLLDQVRRAVYLARREQGHDEGDPDRKGGPPLTERDRARLAAEMVSGVRRPAG